MMVCTGLYGLLVFFSDEVTVRVAERVGGMNKVECVSWIFLRGNTGVDFTFISREFQLHPLGVYHLVTAS